MVALGGFLPLHHQGLVMRNIINCMESQRSIKSIGRYLVLFMLLLSSVCRRDLETKLQRKDGSSPPQHEEYYVYRRFKR